jgi:hypothetical protein
MGKKMILEDNLIRGDYFEWKVGRQLFIFTAESNCHIPNALDLELFEKSEYYTDAEMVELFERLLREYDLPFSKEVKELV